MMYFIVCKVIRGCHIISLDVPGLTVIGAFYQFYWDPGPIRNSSACCIQDGRGTERTPQVEKIRV